MFFIMFFFLVFYCESFGMDTTFSFEIKEGNKKFNNSFENMNINIDNIYIIYDNLKENYSVLDKIDGMVENKKQIIEHILLNHELKSPINAISIYIKIISEYLIRRKEYYCETNELFNIVENLSEVYRNFLLWGKKEIFNKGKKRKCQDIIDDYTYDYTNFKRRRSHFNYNIPDEITREILSYCTGYLNKTSLISKKFNILSNESTFYIKYKGKLNKSILSKFKNIVFFDLSKNKLRNYDINKIVFEKTITKLVLEKNSIGNAGIKKIINCLPNLTYLNLNKNNIEIEGIKLISNLKNILYLSLMYNKVNAYGAEVLSRNSSLTSLNLSVNLLGDLGISHLSKIITLESLYLERNCISSIGIINLFSNESLKSLKVLDLQKNNIGVLGLKCLSENKSIDSLNISYNCIDSYGANELANSESITYLDVGNNKIGIGGIRSLSYNTTFKSLILNNNNIGNAGAISLAYNQTLQHLTLKGNKSITTVGIAALRANTSLQHLEI